MKWCQLVQSNWLSSWLLHTADLGSNSALTPRPARLHPVLVLTKQIGFTCYGAASEYHTNAFDKVLVVQVLQAKLQNLLGNIGFKCWPVWAHC